jgi:gliding motility-associated-like protein
MKDSLNNVSGDPDYKLRRTKFDTVQIYDPITFGTRDSIIVDSLFLDEWDCKGSSNVTLSFTRPDAFGLSQDKKVCPGDKGPGESGGNARIIFDRNGYIDTARITRGPGILPSSSRTMLLINYDSLLDRNDNTPCDLDGFVPPFVTPYAPTILTAGGTTMPIMYTAVNYPQPPATTQWTSASGASAFVHYYPSGTTRTGVTHMPFDPKGNITIGIIVGTGCFSPINCVVPSCISDTVWYHNFFRFIELDAKYLTDNYSSEEKDPNFQASYCYLRGKGDVVTFHYYDSIQDNVIADLWEWGDNTATIDSFYYNPGSDVANNRIRYHFNSLVLPWVHTETEYFSIGTRISIDTIITPLYRCDDKLKALPPIRIDTVINVLDSALMFNPIQHKYVKSSFETMVDDGSGKLVRFGDITYVKHNMITNSPSRCENLSLGNLVIGVIDTFDIKNAAGEWDTVFCQGETVYFYDSIRYWYPSSNCSRPINFPANENDSKYHDRGNMHNWAYTIDNYPIDSIQTNITFDPFNYLTFPGNTAVCPITHLQRVVGVYASDGTPAVRCFKNRQYFHERIYWDFESDGVIDANGPHVPTNVITHKYPVHGRYKVSMISIDSTGRWDTCYQFVNVVKPVAFIEAKDIYICGDKYIFKDSTVLYDNYAVSTGGLDSLDRIVSRKWWFGDRKYFPKAPQSNLKDPVYDYRKNGKYSLRLAVSTEQGCSDTAFKDIFISGPRTHLIVLDDTLGCTPHTVRVVSIPEREPWSNPYDTLTKLTILFSGRPDRYSVPIKYSTIDTAVFYYDQPGTYYISSIAYDNVEGNGGVCKPVITPDTVDGFEKPIRIVVNVPYNVNVLTSKDTVCIGEVFSIINKSDKDTINRYRLDVFDNDGTFANRTDSIMKTNFISDSSWQYRFTKAGQYKLVLNSTKFRRDVSPCKNSDTVTMVASRAIADFTATAEGEDAFRFINKSDTSRSDKYTWKLYNLDGTLFTGYPINFDDASDLNNKYQSFKDLDSSRSFEICIIADVAGSNSCPDSVCKIIQIIVPQSKLRIPNVFTPNGDNVNDVFKIDITNFKKYSLVIWNRWGNTVFESDKPEKMWNGKTNNDGGENPAGTYYYLFNYQLRGAEEKSVRGTITLIRE